MEGFGDGGGGVLGAENIGGDDAGDGEVFEGEGEFLGAFLAAGEQGGVVAEGGFLGDVDIGVADDDQGVGIDERGGGGGGRGNGRGEGLGGGMTREKKGQGARGQDGGDGGGESHTIWHNASRIKCYSTG